MLTPFKVATSCWKSVRPTVGSIIRYRPLRRSRLYSMLPIPKYPTAVKKASVNRTSSAAASGAGTQLAVPPVAGGHERSLRPVKLTAAPAPGGAILQAEVDLVVAAFYPLLGDHFGGAVNLAE